jgi:hypothetical protein
MDKQQAQNFIEETFEQPFDKPRFTVFIKNLLNRIEETPTTVYRGNLIPDAYEQYISSLERIGKYTDSEHKIDILIVKLKKETSLERARTMQRNFIAWYLNGSRGGVLKDAALVAFYNDHSDDWRFSLIKMEYKFGETKTGKITARPELTPARRFSFVVGKDENSHTAQTRFLKYLEDDDCQPTLAQLEESFSIEKVTKEFFEKYRILFNELKDALDDIVEQNEKVRKDFIEKGVDTVNFAKKTLGQIVFLYFLQKKGWFGVARDSNWGTGPKDFLRRLFEEKKYVNFFNDILESLFYEALARERDQNYYKHFNCKIPFLNGGLFDPINEYDWVYSDILIPDNLFSNNNMTKEGDLGTGILDVFDRYNFTVKEDEPLEREVAVDPEMLGKVFENLLEVKDRKSKGTYYTPREIVHYMCRESLISYLDSEPAGADCKRFFTREDIEFLIYSGELIRENDARVQKEGKETRNYPYKVSSSIRSGAVLIDEKLAGIRVCDPAVGSGAFLVGMMMEIIRARQTLSTYIETDEPRNPYAFKRHAIQNSLYGVDIDPGAVEIAKLRLWLSLIVDEDDIREIKPLPNLDYKIMQGNSLLEEFEGIKLFDEKLITDKSYYDTALLKEETRRKRTALEQEYLRLRDAGLLTPLKKKKLELELQKQAIFLKKAVKREEKIPEYVPLFNSEAVKKADELKRLHKEFFEASQKSRKDAIKTRIDTMEWELVEATLREQDKAASIEGLEVYKKANIRPFFLWKFHFAEAFQEKGGFDVVIANPPYVRQETIRHLKPHLAKAFGEFYCGTADIYTYFYKCGIDLLKHNGHLCFIAPNKFMRAGYGKNTRVLLTTRATPKLVIDFGDLPIFDATTYPSILLIEKREPEETDKTIAATFTDSSQLERLEETLSGIAFSMPVKALRKEGWNLERPEILALMEKLRSSGIPLGEYVQGKFYYGIKTGLNEAFVIDEATRAKLIAEDPASAELIKPWLRGRDIKKWKAEWAGLYILYIPWHFELNKFPAVFSYLAQFQEQLENRNESERGRYEWYALQRYAADYYREFDKPKITWGNLATEPKFAFDDSGSYVSAPANIIPTNDLCFLAILNSPISKWWISLQAAVRSGGFLEYKPMYVGEIPIPEATAAQKAPIIERVRKILADPDSSNVPRLEEEIDKLVYDLYGLTEIEIGFIEKKASNLSSF